MCGITIRGRNTCNSLYWVVVSCCIIGRTSHLIWRASQMSSIRDCVNTRLATIPAQLGRGRIISVGLGYVACLLFQGVALQY